MHRSALLSLIACLAAGCGEDLATRGGTLVGGGTLTTNASTPAPAADAKAPATERPKATSSGRTWAEVTRSPWAPIEGETRDARELELAKVCGKRDGALEKVASEMAAKRARGLGTTDADVVAALMRAAGEPHVRPKVIVAKGQAPLDETAVREQLAAAKTAAEQRGGARCAVAIAQTAHGGEVLVAITVEALADLAPVPVLAKTGQWLSFDARVHATATTAHLVILPPHGMPRSVPTNIDAHGMARARFSVDQPGAFTVQLVADLTDGPRPVLEARIFADIAPIDPDDDAPAPGEDASDGSDGDNDAKHADALLRMVTALRAAENLKPLARHPKLDAIARAHAERMRDAGLAVHDAGDGNPQYRFEADASLHAKAIGENVARATSIARAHRALHASPSHRVNLLRADYTHIGIGVATAADGSVYVCETFAAAGR